MQCLASDQHRRSLFSKNYTFGFDYLLKLLPLLFGGSLLLSSVIISSFFSLLPLTQLSICSDWDVFNREVWCSALLWWIWSDPPNFKFSWNLIRLRCSRTTSVFFLKKIRNILLLGQIWSFRMDRRRANQGHENSQWVTIAAQGIGPMWRVGFCSNHDLLALLVNDLLRQPAWFSHDYDPVTMSIN